MEQQIVIKGKSYTASPYNTNNINFISNNWYTNTPILSHANKGYKYFITIGSRGRGKTYSGKNYLAKKFMYRKQEHWLKEFRTGERFKVVWGRLTKGACDKVLADNAAAFFEPGLLNKYNITVRTVGDMIYLADATNYVIEKKQGREIKIYEWHPAIRVLAIQNYFEYKGNQFLDYDEVIIDELVRAKGERNTFNIPTAFKNFIENICRDRTDMRVMIYANAVNELQEMNKLFHFMPLPGKFGMYFIWAKGKPFAVMEYLDDSKEWKERKSVNMAGLLGADNDTEFTNTHQSSYDTSLYWDRAKVHRATLLFKIYHRGMLFNVISFDQGLFIDYAHQREFKHNPVTTYTLSKEHAKPSRMYSPEINKTILKFWNAGKIRFHRHTIAEEFYEMMTGARLFTTKRFM